MLLYCCYTPAHEILFRETFLPSVPPGFEVRDTKLEIAGPGNFLSAEFLQCVRWKVDLIVESLVRNPGETIVWSDVDIRVFELSPESLLDELRAKECEILFQQESPRMSEVNTGFFVCCCTPSVVDFFRAVQTELKSCAGDNEQIAVNRLLNQRAGAESNLRPPPLKWGHLPRRFYARTHGWPPPLKPAIYHANYTKGEDGIGQKLAQFSEIERISRQGRLAWIFSILLRIPAKLLRR